MAKSQKTKMWVFLTAKSPEHCLEESCNWWARKNQVTSGLKTDWFGVK